MPDISFSPPTKLSYENLRQLRWNRHRETKSRAFHERGITLQPGDNIQKALDQIKNEGGGTLRLRPGTYNVSNNIIIPSNTQIIGERFNSVIIDFGGNAYSLKAQGSGLYTTGTLSVNKGSTTVTGSGTTWSSLTTNHLIVIDNYPYIIASIDSDTQLTLGETFSGANQSGETYYAAIFANNIAIQNLRVQNSSTDGIVFSETDLLFIEDCLTLANGGDGLSADRFERGLIDTVIANANTGNGIGIGPIHFSELRWVLSTSNAKEGISLDTAHGLSILSCTADQNSLNGFNINNCNSFEIDGTTCENNIGHGILVVTTNNASITASFANNNGNCGIDLDDTIDVIVMKSSGNDNTNDGIRIIDGSNTNRVIGCSFKDNGAYGANIYEADCNKNVIASNSFSGNTSGQINDEGTGSKISSDNVGSEASTALARVYLGSNQSISDQTETKVQLDTEVNDPGNNFDSTTNYRFTAPIGGEYVVSGAARFAALGDGKAYTVYIYKNGVAHSILPLVTSSATGAQGAYLTDILSLAEDDYIELYARQDSGGAANVQAGSTQTFLSIHRIGS